MLVEGGDDVLDPPTSTGTREQPLSPVTTTMITVTATGTQPTPSSSTPQMPAWLSGQVACSSGREISRLTGDLGDPSQSIWGGPSHAPHGRRDAQWFPARVPLVGIQDPWCQELSEGMIGEEEPTTTQRRVGGTTTEPGVD